MRDKLGFPSTDVGEGWLIFDLPEADMGCHPADPSGQHGKPNGTPDISFYCDDLAATVEALKEKGVEFTSGIENQGFGLVTFFKMPGAGEIQLYQPFYGRDRH